MRQKCNHFAFVLSKIYVEMDENIGNIYSARSWPDDRDIPITGGRITEVGL